MSTLILSQSDVRSLLPIAECIDLMAEVLAALAGGEARNPLRFGLPLEKSGSLLGLMPGSIAATKTIGLKVVTFFPDNHGTPYDSHQGLVVLFEGQHGRPVVIMDASEVTAIRTAATSALATRLLAREDAGDLALLGAGVQARAHLEALASVRDLRRVRVFSPDIAARESFAKRESQAREFSVEPMPTARSALEQADLICTVTSSGEPVLESDWIADGAHINAVGACMAARRELDSATVARASLFVDCRESTTNESGDYLIPLQEGVIGPGHIRGELGEILLGHIPGRTNASELTLFKSLGLAVEDLAAAHEIHARARELGIGTEVELGGLANDPAR